MQVMLQLERDTAQSIRNRTATSPASIEVLQKANELGVALQPLLAPDDNSPLASGFSVEVPDRDAAEQVANALRDCAAVEAAYYMPPTELP